MAIEVPWRHRENNVEHNRAKCACECDCERWQRWWQWRGAPGSDDGDDGFRFNCVYVNLQFFVMFLGLRERILFFENFYSNIIVMALCHCYKNIYPRHLHPPKPCLPFAHLLALIYCRFFPLYWWCVCSRTQRNSLMHFDVFLNNEFSCALIGYDVRMCVYRVGIEFRRKQHVSICVDQQCVCVCMQITQA